MRFHKPSLILPALVAIGLLAGCGGNAAQRSAYESVQNVGQQDCRRDPNARCPGRQSYDEYQKQRDELRRPQ